MSADVEEAKWLAVVGRCLAYLCLKNSDAATQGVREKALFLEKLGLDIEDQAGLVGSTPESLRVMASRAQNKRGGKRRGKDKGGR
jgi:hypothetical protein